LVFVPGLFSNVEYEWEDPAHAGFNRRLAAFSRLIIFDKRGTGLSDRVNDLPTLEERMDDVRAVMDAAGSARAAVVGASEGGPMAVVFAATYPERTFALVLYGATPRYTWAPDFPLGQDTGRIRASDPADRAGVRQPPILRRDAQEPRADCRDGRANTRLLDDLPPSERQSWGSCRAPPDEYGDRRPPGVALDPPPNARPEPHRRRAGARALDGAADSGVRPTASSRASTICRGWVIPRPSATRSRRSSPTPGRSGSGRRQSPSACSRPSSSPTSSARRRGSPTSATEAGGRSSARTMRSSAASSSASADGRSIPPETASSPPSTVRRARSAAPVRSTAQFASWKSTCERAYTRASAR
jgi:pimeloyl-ACP methyl ester carboxylesterase